MASWSRAGLPRNPLAIIQVVEYLRAFLFGRLGWSPMNAVLCISGAFGLFHKETVIAAGGFRTDTVGEDMELVMRLHRFLRHQGKPYRIVFVPDPVCWTEAPESRRVLRSQRIRWQRGLAESLSLNRELLFSKKGGVLGWVAFPFAVLFEFPARSWSWLDTSSSRWGLRSVWSRSRARSPSSRWRWGWVWCSR